jgi:hypothetical protein
MIALTMEAADTSETSVYFRITIRNISQRVVLFRNIFLLQLPK